MGAVDKLLKTAGDVAPTIAGFAAAALTGGNPAVGGVVSSIVGKILGKDAEGKTLEEGARMILGDPEKLQAFRLEMRKAELEELRIRTMDVQNARELAKSSKGPIILSTVVVVGYLAATTLAMTMALPEESQSLAYLLLGNLGTGFGMVLTYWLGTSLGSQAKTQIMQRYMEAAQIDQKTRRMP